MLNEILSILCFQSFIKLFDLSQIKEEITMSKENAEKFLEFIGKNPEILKESGEYYKDQTDPTELLSEFAKAKGFEVEPFELKEVMETSDETSDVLNDDDLENVAGGAMSARTKSRLRQSARGSLSELCRGFAEAMKSGADFSDPKTYIGIGLNSIATGIDAYDGIGIEGTPGTPGTPESK